MPPSHRLLPSLLSIWQLSLDSTGLLPELEPRQPIMAEQEGKPNNQTPAMEQTICIRKEKRGNTTQTLERQHS